MLHRLPKRFIALLLPALLVLSLVTVATFQVGPSHPTASAHSTTALVDVEDNDLPRGSYNTHQIHLHPAVLPLADPINFAMTGSNLPTSTSLTLYSDFGTGVGNERCASNTVDGTVVATSGDGTFPSEPFSASDCRVGNYLIEAIDSLGRVYTAILTVSS